MEHETTAPALREQLLIARGDAAIVTLQAMQKLLAPMLDTNQRVSIQLNKLLENQPQAGTLLSVFAESVMQNVETLRVMHNHIADTMAEIDAFVEQIDLPIDTNAAVENIITAIRSSSTAHAEKTPEEVKKLMGL